MDLATEILIFEKTEELFSSCQAGSSSQCPPCFDGGGVSHALGCWRINLCKKLAAKASCLLFFVCIFETTDALSKVLVPLSSLRLHFFWGFPKERVEMSEV